MTKKGLDRMQTGTVCTARRRNGQPCMNYAIKGATVCRLHGGSAPQVRAAAQVRILMASDLAAKKLVELMSSPTVGDNVKLAAAKELLDRANVVGTQQVNLELGMPAWEQRLLESGAVRRVEIDWAGVDDADVIDAEVVDETEYTASLRAEARAAEGSPSQGLRPLKPRRAPSQPEQDGVPHWYEPNPSANGGRGRRKA
ncbi:HGGxSTG domain-containing protein [Agromyces mediolanus]|uniref:Uncharacterized protein n=1 Tax=Agromyces mediolanus TaxID=41986 RepID=A0A918CLE9_AGRME|nr:HGGxSTG domain-containing protein [Agromyces mediolanus]GGR28884.1 hypothetical protein GCM10010196_23440 [Agromyces mediolanus]